MTKLMPLKEMAPESYQIFQKGTNYWCEVGIQDKAERRW